MKPLTRRSVIAGSAAAMTALPALGLPAAATEGDEKLISLINRYCAEMEALNAKHPITDDEVTEWVQLGDQLLLKAVELPVLSIAGAVAVISLHIDEPMLDGHADFGDGFSKLVASARDVLVEHVQT